MRKEETSEIRKIAQICKTAMECIVSGHYRPLEDRNALSRTSEQDIRRVLKEYNPKELPVMPPDSYFEESADVYEYRYGSGWYVDINLWYPDGESDLTLQLDIRKRGNLQKPVWVYPGGVSWDRGITRLLQRHGLPYPKGTF